VSVFLGEKKAYHQVIFLIIEAAVSELRSDLPSLCASADAHSDTEGRLPRRSPDTNLRQELSVILLSIKGGGWNVSEFQDGNLRVGGHRTGKIAVC
jgi:hypothetical protein